MFRRIFDWKYPIAVVIVLGCFILVSHQDQETRDQYEEKCEQLNARPGTPASHNANCDKGAEDAARHLPRWYRMFGWPEGITTWAILLTLLAIAEQTSQTRVAAEATREAAKAALLNAQAVINAERPWILVVIEPDTSQMGGFNVYFTNKGRTPAIVLGAFIGCAAVEDMGKLPLVATYGPGNMVQTRMAIHGERVWATWFDSRMFKQILDPDFLGAIGDKQVFVFGKVIYRDLLNPDTKLLHETRWIGLYQPPVGDDGGNSIFRFEGIGVSDEYERYT